MTAFDAASRGEVEKVEQQATRGFLAAMLEKTLDDAVWSLSECRELGALVDGNPAWERAFLERADTVLQAAFSRGDAFALKEIHRALFWLYELHVLDGASPRAVNQFDPTLTRLRARIERAWLAHAQRQAEPERVAADSESVVSALRTLWAQHPVAAHPLFDFLEKDASREQIVTFFKSDSALNIRFFDLLVYSMIGSRMGVRKELAQNFWDESGRGDAQRGHVSLFQYLLDTVGVERASDHHASELNWQGLAGYNLFMLCCVNRQHYFKLLGVMAMTELLDPSQYAKLARGCERVGLGAENELEYYLEHVTIDVVHGEGWLANVISPVVEETPEVAQEIVLGAALRLASCNEYYDALYARILDR
ncbi:iron-containing redox enzyme family protein [Paraburkholderia bannensis]|uniref:iron-containing redox enzyme family protein n=1 Tax=Paraburkholderia bannensis TaxID=765414 RepID=UPI000A01D992|nr:iron-containing redox enzyme family protein [Paraburkholderia bannensis]